MYMQRGVKVNTRGSPATSLASVFHTSLLALVALAVVSPLLFPLISLRLSDSLNTPLDPSSLTSLLDDLLHTGHLAEILRCAKFLLNDLEHLVAVGHESLVRLPEGLVRRPRLRDRRIGEMLERNKDR